MKLITTFLKGSLHMPGSSSSSNLPPYALIPFLGTPLWVIFHPDAPYQPYTYVQTYSPPQSGQIQPPTGYLMLYPPPGLNSPNAPLLTPAQPSGSAASSWEQPAHLIEPAAPPVLLPAPSSAIPLPEQTSIIEILHNVQHGIAPFLSATDIARLNLSGHLFFSNAIAQRPIAAYTYQDINGIPITPAGAIFLNALIADRLLTATQYRYLDRQHLNQLNNINTVTVMTAIDAAYSNPAALPQALSPADQFHSLDMLHLYWLGSNYCRTLEQQRKLDGQQRSFIDQRNLISLVRETNNPYFENTYLGNSRRSRNLDETLIKQLFILAAGTGRNEYLPGIGAATYLDAPTLSYGLPSGSYVVTQLFFLYQQQHTAQAPNGQIVVTQDALTGNVTGNVGGHTLNQISAQAFDNLAEYVNTHNTQIQFTPTNLWGLSDARILSITDKSLLQTFIAQQFPHENWRNYFQTHYQNNSWGEFVGWLNQYNNLYNQYTPQQLNQIFAAMAQFARHRLTILQDIYNALTDEQKAMFGDALGYHGQGGRRTTDLTMDDSDNLASLADGTVANVALLEQLLIRDTRTEILGSAKSQAFVRVGETVNGSLEQSKDHDWYKVDLKAGLNYKFLLKHTNNAELLDPWLNLRNSNGIIIKSDDDSAGHLNSLIQFKATQTNTYFLDVCSWHERSNGQFSLSVIAA